MIKLLLLASVIGLTVCACNQTSNSDKNTPGADVVAVDSKLNQKQIQALVDEAISELDKKNFGRSVDITVRVTQSDPNNAEAYFIEAQGRSMSGDMKSALSALEQALKKGFKDFERITGEKRLESVRATPEFPKLIQQFNSAAPASVGSQEIKAGNVSIKEEGGNQVIKAGDITIRVPKD